MPSASRQAPSSPPGSDSLRAIARRAARRVFADRGRHAPLGARKGGARVAVEVRPWDLDVPAATRSAELVSLRSLAHVPPGGRVAVEGGALVTPLAREEAFRRGIALDSSGLPLEARTGPAALTIAVGADHGGFPLKSEILTWLADLGHRPLDFGARDTTSCDYPHFARLVAEAVASGNAHLGVVVDGAGIGSAMVANKVAGVLAANCWNEAAARNAREHNHANVLTLGAGMLEREAAHVILRAFLSTPVGPGRHERRVDMIRTLDLQREEHS